MRKKPWDGNQCDKSKEMKVLGPLRITIVNQEIYIIDQFGPLLLSVKKGRQRNYFTSCHGQEKTHLRSNFRGNGDKVLHVVRLELSINHKHRH